MKKIRVLVIDDSVVVRRVLTAMIQSDPALEVAATAPTASVGIQKISQVTPDLVLLDLDMPEMDGLEAASQIRKTWPRLPIVMCSSLTARGAEITFRALEAGATDCIAKPDALSGTAADGASFRSELILKIKALCRENTAQPPPQKLTPPVSPVVTERRERRISIVAIGCSTGGPNALTRLFTDLPELNVPIVIVQHMPPLFTKILADRLAVVAKRPIKEACDGDRLEAGHAYMAPGNFHMIVTYEGARIRLGLTQEPHENSCRPSVDVLFRSVARVYGATALAVVLTGMGQDGGRGAMDIVEAGGTAIVEHDSSCVVPSMPRAVVSRGVSDGAYSIDRMGSEIGHRVRRSQLGAGPFGRSKESLRAHKL